MKKILITALCLIALFSVSSCTSEEGDVSANNETPEVTITETENDNTPTDTKTSEINQKNITFEEVLAIDNEECTIKITEIDPDNLFGYTLKVNPENKSSEKTYMFSVESASVNNIECDPFFATSVAAEKYAFKSVTWSETELEENGITEIEEIEFLLKVYDSDNWSADYFVEEVITLKP